MAVPHAHLLLVSDNEKRRDQVCEALADLPEYATSAAFNADQAATLLSVEKFDVVLVDSRLGGCTAHDFLESVVGDVPLPFITFGSSEDLPLMSQCLQEGAVDFFLLPINSHLLKVRVKTHLQKKLLQEQAITALQAFDEVEKLADDLRLVILPLSVALTAEKDFDRLVERFVLTAMNLCQADSGALFMRTENDELQFSVLRIESLDVAAGGTTGRSVPYENLALFDGDGRPIVGNVAAFVAHEGISVNVADVYDDSGFDFSGTRQFDHNNNYRTVSCLTVPLINQQVSGVLQLRNAQNPQTGEVIPFGAYQQLVAESLASQVAVALHNRRLRERETSLLRYKRELQIGREIQAGFFPKNLPQPPGWQLTARFQPAREVAGDFYDAFPAPMAKVGFIIADVCDKGVVAALFMALLRSLLRAFILQHYNNKSENTTQGSDAWQSGPITWPRPFFPSDKAALLDAIRLTNAYIGSNHADTNIFATLFVGILNPISGHLIYINCGHLPPLKIGADKRVKRLMPSGPAIGLLPDARFTVQEVYLQPGDTLLAFTDGVTEARDAQNEFFGTEPLISLVTENHTASAGKIAEVIESAVAGHSGSSIPFDDIAFLILKRDDPPPNP